MEMAMEDNLKQYLLDKMNGGGYQNALAQQQERTSDLALPQLAAGIGDALAGRGSGDTNRQFQTMRGNIADDTTGEFLRQKVLAQADTETQKKLRLTDPNSQDSINFRSLVSNTMPTLAKSYGSNWDKVAAADQDSILNFGKMRANIDARNALYQQQAYEKSQTRDATRALKEQALADKAQALETPYGPANSVSDAKDVKESFISKQGFDSKLQEMINLRKKYGGELWNREAVARGQQLSKDLLLEYKNMAKLGVLSAADEAIINAIIPSDPLSLNPAGLLGQDPVLVKLEDFKNDKAKDFAARVQTKTKGGLSNLQSEGLKPDAAPAVVFPMQVRKDGKVAIVKNEKELKEVTDEGWE